MSLAARLIIIGRVQGVGYRFFAQDAARGLGLKGWVRNLPDGRVEVHAEGPRPAVEQFIEQLQKGPPMARVESVQTTWQSSENQYGSFTIIS